MARLEHIYCDLPLQKSLNESKLSLNLQVRYFDLQDQVFDLRSTLKWHNCNLQDQDADPQAHS